MPFSATEGFSEKIFWSTSNLLLKCGNTPMKRRGGQEGFSGAVCLFRSFKKNYKNTVVKIAMLSISFFRFWTYLDNRQ